MIQYWLCVNLGLWHCTNERRTMSGYTMTICKVCVQSNYQPDSFCFVCQSSRPSVCRCQALVWGPSPAKCRVAPTHRETEWSSIGGKLWGNFQICQILAPGPNRRQSVPKWKFLAWPLPPFPIIFIFTITNAPLADQLCPKLPHDRRTLS